MTDTKPKRRWFRFSIRDLLLLTVIVAIATGWWLDHRRLVTLIPSSNPSNYLVDLNLSKDEKLSLSNRQISSLETIYANAKVANDEQLADTMKTKIDKLKMQKEYRSDELRPKVIAHLQSEIAKAAGK